MTQGHPSSANDRDLVSRIRAVWLRSIVNAALRLAGRGLLAGATAWWTWWLASTVFFVPNAVAFVLVPVATGIVLITHAFHIANRPDTFAKAALRVDTVASLDERSVSGYEHAYGSTPSSRFRDVLIRDATKHVGGVDPRTIVPLVRPVPLVTGAMLLVIAGFVGPPSVTVAPHLTAGRTPTENDTSIEELAERIDEEVAGTNDPYLQAVREAVRRLSDELDTGVVSEEEASRRLESLSDHVRRAFDRAGLPDPTRPRSGSVGESPRAGDTVEPDAVSALPSPSTAPIDGLENVEEPQPLQASDADGPSPEGGPQIRRDSSTTDAPSTVDYGQLALDQEDATPEGSQPSSDAPGEAIAAAQQSSQGASERAGAGSQPLDGDSERRSSVERVEAVALPEADTGEGRRIDIDLTPDEELGTVTDDPGRIGAWRMAPEAKVAPDPIADQHIDALRRFFTPPDDEPDQEAP